MNAEEFKRLMAPLGRRMFCAAVAITGNGADAEDAVQNALVSLWQHRDRLQQARSAEAYASTAARNAALDLIDSRRYFEPLDSSMPDASRPADPLEQRDAAARLMALIASLPEPQRTVMTLRAQGGLSTDEIHHQTGLSAENIRVILSRARKTLRSLFHD